MLEFTIRPYKKRECVEESSSSTTVTESDKKSTDPITTKSEEREMITPPTNFDAKMKNVFEAIVELHLTMCYPPTKVLSKNTRFY